MQAPTPSAAVVSRNLDLSTPNVLASGESGSVFYKTQADTILRGIEHAEDVVVVGVYAGKRELNRAPDQSWSDALGEGAAISEGQSITAIIQNVGAEPKAAGATFIIEEQALVVGAEPSTAGPLPQKQFGFGVERSAARTVTSGNAPANTPFIRRTSSGQSQQSAPAQKQSTDVIQNPDGTTRKVVRTVLPPIAERSPEVAAQIRAAGGPSSQTRGTSAGSTRRGATVRANGKAPARVNPPKFHGGGSPTPSSSSQPSNGRTRTIRSGGGQGPTAQVLPARSVSGSAASATSAMTNGGAVDRSVVVMPADGEFTFALLTGHAERLLLRVESNIALPKMFRPSITRALATASTEPLRAGGNDVVISVAPSDLSTLRQMIIAGGLALDDASRDRIARAIRRGLAVVRGEIAQSATNVADLSALDESSETHAQNASDSLG